MLEEVYAVAPGASLVFCGPTSDIDYEGCLQQLIAYGATVIVDDLGWPTEDLMSSTSMFAQNGAKHSEWEPECRALTVTENYNGSYWEGSYAPTSLASLGYGSFTCPANGQVDYYVGVPETLTVGQVVSKPIPVNFQWADPYGANVSNFDLYIVNNQTQAVV